MVQPAPSTGQQGQQQSNPDSSSSMLRAAMQMAPYRVTVGEIHNRTSGPTHQDPLAQPVQSQSARSLRLIAMRQAAAQSNS